MFFLPVLILGLTIALAVPLGMYLHRVLDGSFRPPAPLSWVERAVDTGAQTWKQYALSLLVFNLSAFVVAFAVLAAQPVIPFLNPDGKGMLAPTTIFNTLCSFLTNTNLQHYAGEVHLSYFSQLVVIAWNMFYSPAVGIAALVAMTRALRGDPTLGNFYIDLWRGTVYVMLPLSLVMGVLLMATGMPMTFDGQAQAGLADATETSGKAIARGPVAAVVAVKQLGTNGGGFFGTNSTHPFENPTAASNLLECVAIALLPIATLVLFGKMLRSVGQAAVIFGVMLIFSVGTVAWAVYFDAMQPNPALTAHAAETYPGPTEIRVARAVALPVDQELGNLEGKELRFGTAAGATWAALTTNTSNGSVNCMHDSLNPLAGLVPLTGMWLNCIWGGVGVGLINMLVYLITGVFLAGLMVGRTPEYLGKKVEAREMKLAMLVLLIHPLMILAPTGLFAVTDWGSKATNNPAAHGFSEILYEFTSASANNGSGFEGLGDTWGFNDPAKNVAPPAEKSAHWDIATGLVMIICRFIPIVGPLALAASLAAKKPTPFTTGTLRTDTATFGFVLLGTIVLVGALLFLPAAVLGPVAEHLGPMPFRSMPTGQ